MGWSSTIKIRRLLVTGSRFAWPFGGISVSRLHVTGVMAARRSLLVLQFTVDLRASLESPADAQGASDDLRSVAHGTQPHPRLEFRGAGDSDAVVGDVQLHAAAHQRQPDHDLAGLSVADGVLHRLLRNPVQVRCR